MGWMSLFVRTVGDLFFEIPREHVQMILRILFGQQLPSSAIVGVGNDEVHVSDAFHLMLGKAISTIDARFGLKLWQAG